MPVDPQTGIYQPVPGQSGALTGILQGMGVMQGNSFYARKKAAQLSDFLQKLSSSQDTGAFETPQGAQAAATAYGVDPDTIDQLVQSNKANQFRKAVSDAQASGGPIDYGALATQYGQTKLPAGMMAAQARQQATQASVGKNMTSNDEKTWSEVYKNTGDAGAATYQLQLRKSQDPALSDDQRQAAQQIVDRMDSDPEFKKQMTRGAVNWVASRSNRANAQAAQSESTVPLNQQKTLESAARTTAIPTNTASRAATAAAATSRAATAAEKVPQDELGRAEATQAGLVKALAALPDLPANKAGRDALAGQIAALGTRKAEIKAKGGVASAAGPKYASQDEFVKAYTAKRGTPPTPEQIAKAASLGFFQAKAPTTP